MAWAMVEREKLIEPVKPLLLGAAAVAHLLVIFLGAEGRRHRRGPYQPPWPHLKAFGLRQRGLRLVVAAAAIRRTETTNLGCS